MVLDDVPDVTAFAEHRGYNEQATIRHYRVKLGQFVRLCFLMKTQPTSVPLEALRMLQKPLGLTAFFCLESIKKMVEFFLATKGGETATSMMSSLKAFCTFVRDCDYWSLEKDIDLKKNLVMRVSGASDYLKGWLRKTKAITRRERAQKRTFEERSARGECFDVDQYQSVLQNIYEEIQGESIMTRSRSH